VYQFGYAYDLVVLATGVEFVSKCIVGTTGLGYPQYQAKSSTLDLARQRTGFGTQLYGLS
jgi:hypothetical protein